MCGAVIVMTPFEGAVRGSLEGSRGGRIYVFRTRRGRTSRPRYTTIGDSTAGRVFDFNRRRPQVMRIAMWAQLERPPSAADAPEPFATKVQQVSAAAEGEIRPTDLLSFVYALAQAWFFTPVGLLASDGSDPDDPRRIADHRSALVAAVERLSAHTSDRPYGSG